MKKILFLLLFTVSIYGQTLQNPTYGTVTEKNNATDNTPAYFTTTQVDGVHKKTPAALVEKTANKSDSYTVSSSNTYASSKALVDGLETKANIGTAYNTNIYSDKIVIYGNSIETGAGAIPRSIYGWQAVAPQILGTKVDNYAISGTTMVKFFNGDNSGIDRLSIITPAYTSNIRAYISGIGVNDMYNVNGTYNETNFRTAYNTLIDQLVTNGWPLSKIYLFLPLTVNANTTLVNATIANIALLKGVNFIDVKGAMDTNGGMSLVSGDGIHPNNAGHKIIAKAITDAITGAKFDYTQFHQDISTTGVVNAGVGISGGSGSNGLEIRGTHEVNNSGKISLFGDVYFNKNILSLNNGPATTPKYISLGNEYADAVLNGFNLQLYTYNRTGLGTTATDGLGLYSIAGSTARITSYQDHYFKNNAILNDIGGAVTTPLKFKAGQSTFINGAISVSNTTFAGYGGSGIGFSATEGVSLISGNGLTPLITLKNPVNVSGNLSATGNIYLGSSLSGSQTVPSFLDLGNSYANATTTGSSLKLKLYANTGIGVDATNGLALLSNAGTGYRITSMSNHAFAYSIFITTAPTTSAGTYDILTRNTSTGVVEKISSSLVNILPSNNTFTGENTFSNYTIFGSSAKLKNYTVATLPEGNQGDIAFVTDALAPTYLTTVVGGGAVVCPVFYNGTSWVAH